MPAGSQERQSCIDRFNQRSEAYPVFLLSTRAGGQGINLATADTVRPRRRLPLQLSCSYLRLSLQLTPAPGAAGL